MDNIYKIKEFLKNHKSMCVILIIIPIIACVIFIPIFCKYNTINDLGSFLGGLLAYIGTVLLGIVAMWQNEKNNVLIYNEKRSLLYFRKKFIYKKVQVESNKIIEESKINNVNYFLVKEKNFNEESMFGYEKLTFLLTCKQCDLASMNLKKIVFKELGKNDIEFYIYDLIKHDLIFDVDKETYEVSIIFLTKSFSIFYMIYNAQSLLHLELEYENTYGIIENRICEINFGNAFERHNLLDTHIDSEFRNISYKTEEKKQNEKAH